MKNQNGLETKLSELDGKVVLLEFWASWCLPCRIENPILLKTYNKFSQNEFEIFAVSLDQNKEDWFNAIEKDNLKWKHVSDLKGRNNLAALIYAVNGIPDNILIDKNGIIVGRNLKGEALYKKISDALSSLRINNTNDRISETFKIPTSTIWKDENGKELNESEVNRMLDSNMYTPVIDTEKNVVVLKKS